MTPPRQDQTAPEASARRAKRGRRLSRAGLVTGGMAIIGAAALVTVAIARQPAAAGPSAAEAPAGGASAAGASAAGVGQSARTGGLLPGQLYAPYVETWTGGNLPAIASQSGARYLTLAFVQTAKPGSCVLTWNGQPDQTIASGAYLGQIAQLRAMGGDVILSFGGYDADQAGTEIADSCTSVPEIAAAYESVVLRYSVTRIDLDIEAKSLTRKAGIARRSAALALLQRWATRTGRQVQVVLTVGVSPTGLAAGQLAVLRSAVTSGVSLTAVNLMAFDYENASSANPVPMGATAISALRAAWRQLGEVYPELTAAQLWSRLGVTLMPGIDDFAKKTEITYLPDAAQVLAFARTAGLSLVSIWALERDNGRCPGVAGSDSCSGITQSDWEFSQLLEPY